MRDNIKFRVWDKEKSMMVYGHEIEEATRPYVEEVSHRCYTFRYLAGLSYGSLYVAYYDKQGDWTECEIMQNTGLHDKNGKDIYDGDVVKLQINQHVWFYQIGCSGVDGVNLCAINIRDNITIDDESDTYTYQITDMRRGLTRPIPHGCEIIGNIYETPELLTK